MRFSLGTAIFLAGAGVAHADAFTAALQGYLDAEIAGYAQDQRLVDAINAQNDDTAAYDQARIDELDGMWRSEIGMSDAPTITPVIENALSAYLRDAVSASDGRIVEVFVMDSQGLNVAASAPTSDYWQGDEAKFQETYGAGPGATHISDVEFDESSQSYQGQISMTVVDPATGEAIGAVTFGVDPEAL